uniref:DUF7745 domain-containing protein n=1 Tax=Fagus sylvatica TaxID=28930 RepID=A0A2N9H9R8_FAGSY
MASSSGNSDSLVTLRFHDFRVERMRHWWTLLGKDDHADIVGLFGQFPSLMRLRVDHGLLEALASFWDPTHCCFSIGEVDLVPTLEEQEGMEEIPNQRLQDCLRRRRGEGVSMFCTQLLQLWFCSHLQHFYRLQTPYHFERHIVRQTVKIALPFIGNSHDWALYLLDLPLSEWSWKVTWGPAAWAPWTHCALFDGVPLPGVWGCTGYYPNLALLSFVQPLDLPVQYPWKDRGYLGRPPFRALGPYRGWFVHGDSSRPTVRPGALYCSVSRSLRVSASTGQSGRVAVLERELEEARAELSSLRLAKASEKEESAARVESMRSTLHHNSVAVANLRRDLEAAKDHMEETLTETQGQLETEQVERTRVQDELDSLRSYTQALVDLSTGHPHDIVALRRALDEREVALTSSARTSMGAMQEGFPVVTALHQVNQVMDSLGARARAVLEEHDEEGSGPFHCLGEILQRDLHTSWSLVGTLQVAVK